MAATSNNVPMIELARKLPLVQQEIPRHAEQDTTTHDELASRVILPSGQTGAGPVSLGSTVAGSE